MNGREQLQLLQLQDEVERLRDLLEDLAGDQRVEPLRQLLREAESSLRSSEQIGTAAGLLSGPLPWWEDWQRRHNAEPEAPESKRPRSLPRRKGTDQIGRVERQLRDGEARIIRQKAVLARLSHLDHPLLPHAEALLHALMRAQLLAKVRLIWLQRSR